MAQVPTPPASPLSRLDSHDNDADQADADAFELLDNLLAKYLELLDQHQSLQAKLNQSLASVGSSIYHPHA